MSFVTLLIVFLGGGILFQKVGMLVFLYINFYFKLHYRYAKWKGLPLNKDSTYWNCRTEHIHKVIRLLSKWNGYHVEGIENIPTSKPVIFILYHGYIASEIRFLQDILYDSGLKVLVNTHHFLLSIGGNIVRTYGWFCDGSVNDCVDLLCSGKSLIIAPGGNREAILSDNRYELKWGNRLGFAKVALQANVPLIPVFTKNVREMFPEWGAGITHKLYEKYGFVFKIAIGPLPVKLTTFIGKPIPYNLVDSPKEVARKAKQGLEDLIRKHQRIPGNTWMALKERFYS